MEALFLRLKQFIVANDVAGFDAHVASLQDPAKGAAVRFPVDHVDSSGYTLLHLSCHLSNHVFAQKLLQLGVSINHQDAFGKTALHKVIERSQIDPEEMMSAFSPFLTSEHLQVADKTGRTALHMACIKGFVGAVEVLVEKGASLTARDKRGWTALHFASFYARLPVVKYLISKGVDVSIASQDGWSAMHVAASQGNDGIVCALFENGADTNQKALNGQTPLHVACLNSHASTVRVLRENDGDAKVIDKSGLSPLACAPKEIRSVIRKTVSKNTTDAGKTSVVGMPHNPMAERDAKFAIQARDSANRRRSHGGDLFVISIVSTNSDAISSVRGTVSAEAIPSKVVTMNGLPKPKMTASSSASEVPLSTFLPAPQNALSSSSIPSAVSNLKGSDSFMSGSRGSLDDLPPPKSSSPPTNRVHNSDEPRSLLRSSQAVSTPAMFGSPSRKESSQHLTPGSPVASQSIQNGLDLATSPPVVFADDLGPRSQSDMPRNRAVSEAPNRSPYRHTINMNSGSVLTNSSNSACSMKDLESGIYILRWRPPMEGEFQISITLNDRDILGSPFAISVSASRSRVPTDLRRLVGATSSTGPTRSSSIGASSEDDGLSTRTQSTPVDLISNLKPDLTPKPNSNGSQSAPALKKTKKGKGGSSIVITTPSSSVVSTPTALSPPADSSSRKRSSSSAAAQKPTATEQAHTRDRSGTTVPSSNDATAKPTLSVSQNLAVPASPSTPLQTPPASPLSHSSPSLPNNETPSANSSSSRDRNLYRMTSTFSPLRPLTETSAAPDAEALAAEVQSLEANLTNLTRQLAEFSLRIQELETDHLIAAKKHEDSKAEDRGKMVKLATALRAERDARLCKGCRQSSKNAVAVPCLHMSHCNACLENMENCPVCNAHLKGFISANLEQNSLDNSTPR